MTIRAYELKIAQLVITPIPILVMHMQYLVLAVSAAFTLLTPLREKSKLQHSLTLHLVVRTSQLV
jgi:hypothetical protein